MPSQRPALFGSLLPLAFAVAGCSSGSPSDQDTNTSKAALIHGPRGTTPAAGANLHCDVLVAGGGAGGVAAGIAAARTGVDVCISEETDWVGGQFTTQGLNASDDNQFTDGVGETGTYARMRALMRGQYGGASNPGGCWVSHLCAEPSSALDAIATLMTPYLDAGNLHIFYNARPTSVSVDAGAVTGVTYARTSDNGAFSISANLTIDATELGDIIKLSGAGYRAGQEPQSDTGEHDAPVNGCAECIQSFTYDVVLERRPAGENNVIPKPQGYGVDPWMKDYTHDDPAAKKHWPMFGGSSVWEYRRIVNGAARGRTDLSVMNWSEGNDYYFGGLVDKSPAEMATQLERARLRALGYVYWLQTEADGNGYPFLKLRSDVLGTTTGVSKYPYIREGRRLRAMTTIRTEDVTNAYVKNSARARDWWDSVGIGFYGMDMHRNVAAGSGWPAGDALPYQIPLGALIPESMNGLLAGAKDLGTTHLTNSAYRLHPTEWAIGEAAGTWAALCVSWKEQPRDAYAFVPHVRELQDRLLGDGAPVYWMKDVARQDPLWHEMQLVAVTQVMGGPEATTLNFRPELVINRAQAAAALVNALALPLAKPTSARFTDVPRSHWAFEAIETLAANGIAQGEGNGIFAPQDPVTSGQMRALISRTMGDAVAARAVPATPNDEAGMPRGNASKALAVVTRTRMNLP